MTITSVPHSRFNKNSQKHNFSLFVPTHKCNTNLQPVANNRREKFLGSRRWFKSATKKEEDQRRKRDVTDDMFTADKLCEDQHQL